MAKCKIEFIIASDLEVKDLYIVGNTKELGSWDPKKAVKLSFNADLKSFTLSKMFNLGEVVEYKVLNAKSWDNVEVGMWNEELENHVFAAKKGHKEEHTIGYFKNI